MFLLPQAFTVFCDVWSRPHSSDWERCSLKYWIWHHSIPNFDILEATWIKLTCLTSFVWYFAILWRFESLVTGAPDWKKNDKVWKFKTRLSRHSKEFRTFSPTSTSPSLSNLGKWKVDNFERSVTRIVQFICSHDLKCRREFLKSLPKRHPNVLVITFRKADKSRRFSGRRFSSLKVDPKRPLWGRVTSRYAMWCNLWLPNFSTSFDDGVLTSEEMAKKWAIVWICLLPLFLFFTGPQNVHHSLFFVHCLFNAMNFSCDWSAIYLHDAIRWKHIVLIRWNVTYRCYWTSVRSVMGKYWSRSFSINFQKKNETNVFPVRTEQVSSIKFFSFFFFFFLIIMALFRISWRHSTLYRW